MTLNQSSNDPRLAQLRQDHSRRMTRFLIAFATVEGLALGVTAVVVFGLALVDPELGIRVILIVAMLGALIMGVTIVGMIRGYHRSIRDLTGY